MDPVQQQTDLHILVLLYGGLWVQTERSFGVLPCLISEPGMLGLAWICMLRGSYDSIDFLSQARTATYHRSCHSERPKSVPMAISS